MALKPGGISLVTETAPETATTEALPSTQAAAPSERTPVSPSLAEDTKLAAPDETRQPAEDDDDEGEGAGEAPKPLAEWTLQDFEEKFDRDGLTPEEGRAYREVQRAEANRARDYAEQESRRRQQVDQVVTKWQQAPTKISSAVLDIVKEILPDDVQLTPSQREALNNRVWNELQGLFTGTNEPIIEGRRDRFKAIAADQGIGEMSPADLRRLGEMGDQDIDQLFIGIGFRKGVEEGRKAGVDKDHVLLTKEEHKEYQALKKAQSTAEKAQNPDKVPPSKGSRPGAGTAVTPTNMRDVRLMHIGQHPSGARLTTQEMRDYESRNYRGEFPD